MELLSCKAAAQMLDLTTDAIRYHERCGHILAIHVNRGTAATMRLFVKEDIERFQRERLSQAQEREAAKSEAADAHTQADAQAPIKPRRGRKPAAV